MKTEKILVPIHQNGIIADVGMNISVQCLTCEHLRKPLTCEAFPQSIPKKILNGEIDHSKPLPNQKNNIAFEMRSGPQGRMR